MSVPDFRRPLEELALQGVASGPFDMRSLGDAIAEGLLGGGRIAFALEGAVRLGYLSDEAGDGWDLSMLPQVVPSWIPAGGLFYADWTVPVPEGHPIRRMAGSTAGSPPSLGAAGAFFLVDDTEASRLEEDFGDEGLEARLQHFYERYPGASKTLMTVIFRQDPLDGLVGPEQIWAVPLRDDRSPLAGAMLRYPKDREATEVGIEDLNQLLFGLSLLCCENVTMRGLQRTQGISPVKYVMPAVHEPTANNGHDARPDEGRLFFEPGSFVSDEGALYWVEGVAG